MKTFRIADCKHDVNIFGQPCITYSLPEAASYGDTLLFDMRYCVLIDWLYENVGPVQYKLRIELEQYPLYGEGWRIILKESESCPDKLVAWLEVDDDEQAMALKLTNLCDALEFAFRSS